MDFKLVPVSRLETPGRRAKLLHLAFPELQRTQREIIRGEMDAERAKHELIEANLRLVVSIAKKYGNRGLKTDSSTDKD